MEFPPILEQTINARYLNFQFKIISFCVALMVLLNFCQPSLCKFNSLKQFSSFRISLRILSTTISWHLERDNFQLLFQLHPLLCKLKRCHEFLLRVFGVIAMFSKIRSVYISICFSSLTQYLFILFYKTKNFLINRLVNSFKPSLVEPHKTVFTFYSGL